MKRYPDLHTTEVLDPRVVVGRYLPTLVRQIIKRLQLGTLLRVRLLKPNKVGGSFGRLASSAGAAGTWLGMHPSDRTREGGLTRLVPNDQNLGSGKADRSIPSGFLLLLGARTFPFSLALGFADILVVFVEQLAAMGIGAFLSGFGASILAIVPKELAKDLLFILFPSSFITALAF